jgi:hypothetical protein
MADAPTIPDEAEVRARWGAFAWSEDNVRKAHEIIGRCSTWRNGRWGRRRTRKAGCPYR